jgi:hypothetical protein
MASRDEILCEWPVLLGEPTPEEVQRELLALKVEELLARMRSREDLLTRWG